jgi:hypothetical protein
MIPEGFFRTHPTLVFTNVGWVLLVLVTVPKNLTRTKSWFWNRVDTELTMEGSVLRTGEEPSYNSLHLSN